MRGKYRVAVQALAFKRDLPSRYILSKLLENYGCDVFITTIRNFSKVQKYWRPHAFVHTTASHIQPSIKTFPDQKIFYCAGEGAEFEKTFEEQFFVDNEDVLKKMSRIYLWGKITKQYMIEMAENISKPHLKDIIEKGDKFVVNGHPRLDLCKYIHDRPDKENKSIGIVGHFHTINSFTGRSTLSFVFADDTHIANAEFELNLLKCYKKIIDYIIEHTSYNISIRPYPFEDTSQYFDRKGKDNGKEFINKKYRGRVTIDDSLDFSTWANDQKVIISSQSTTVTDAFVMNIPVINVNYLDGNMNTIIERGYTYEVLATAPYQPKTYEELYEALKKIETIPLNKHKLKDLWDRCYNLNQPGSALKRMAKSIVAELEKGHHNLKPLLPKAVLKLYDNYSFRRACKNDPFHPNFNYKEGYHKIPPHYDKIVQNILNDSND